MKIVFLSDIFNHHQKAFSDAMYRMIGENYTFIETKTISDERKNMGWGTQGYPTYVVSLEKLNQYRDQYSKLIDTADLVITGSAPELFLTDRKKNGHLIFRYSERILKRKNVWYKYPYRFLRLQKLNMAKKPIYMLCSSAYTATDYAKFALYRKRAYRWGYFPKTQRYNSISELEEKKNRQEILWCGRFLNLKHPDDVIRVAKKLKDNAYSFELNMIGTGVMEDELHQMIREYDLADCVNLIGTMSPDQVREHMEHAGIYLFTSDRQEGWGAVLNESMNSGCAVIASHAIGAVPFLLEDGQNGQVYESGNVDMLCEKVMYLLDHPEEQARLGTKAYETIINEWNGEIAAERLIVLLQRIMAGEKYPDLYSSGPCSCAPRLRDDWFTKKKGQK